MLLYLVLVGGLASGLAVARIGDSWSWRPVVVGAYAFALGFFFVFGQEVHYGW